MTMQQSLRAQVSFNRVLRGIRYNSVQNTRHRSPLAFAFDIDGVLLRGPNVLPAARRALDFLAGNNPLNVQVPYVLLTNGGGETEADRCQKLTKQLGIPIQPTQLIQAHTILKDLKHKYADVPVLVLGGEGNKGREVAESYGFKRVYIPLDILAWDKSIWPFHRLTDAEQSFVKPADFSTISFHAVIVLHDPRNWGLDIQVVSDILRSSNQMFRQSFRPPSTDRPSNGVELVFCNPDLLWKSDYPLSRYGQGAFKDAFQAVYRSATGHEYPVTQFGKPFEATYSFAAKMLNARVAELEGLLPTKPPKIYMIGDNPASDIAGANAASWNSVLVRTGVYDPAEGPPAHTPTAEAEDVEEAVKWAFERELILGV